MLDDVLLHAQIWRAHDDALTTLHAGRLDRRLRPRSRSSQLSASRSRRNAASVSAFAARTSWTSATPYYEGDNPNGSRRETSRRPGDVVPLARPHSENTAGQSPCYILNAVTS